MLQNPRSGIGGATSRLVIAEIRRYRHDETQSTAFKRRIGCEE